MIEPKISIIMPNFNKALFIEETLKSIKSQTYKNWEVIIVDDGSTDNSIAIIERYTNKDKRFHLIKRSRLPKGDSVCRNIGIDNSDGEYVIFLDSDDLIEPFCLENRLNKFSEHKENDFIVFSAGMFYKEIGDTKHKIVPPDISKDHLKMFLRHNFPWTISSPIWKKSFLLKVNGFNEIMPRIVDVEMHTRVLLTPNVKYTVLAEETLDFYYRQDKKRHVHTYSSQFYKKFLKGTDLYVNNISELLKSQNLNNYIKHLFGTILVVMTIVKDAKLEKNISLDEEKLFEEKLFEIVDNIPFSVYQKFLFRLYVGGYDLKLNKIRGYKSLFRKIILI